MHEMTLSSENLDRIRSRRAKERSGLAQITFKILSTLLTSPPCIFLLPNYKIITRFFSLFPATAVMPTCETLRRPRLRGRRRSADNVCLRSVCISPPFPRPPFPRIYQRPFICLSLRSPYTYITRTHTPAVRKPFVPLSDQMC